MNVDKTASAFKWIEVQPIRGTKHARSTMTRHPPSSSGGSSTSLTAIFIIQNSGPSALNRSWPKACPTPDKCLGLVRMVVILPTTSWMDSTFDPYVKKIHSQSELGGCLCQAMSTFEGGPIAMWQYQNSCTVPLERNCCVSLMLQHKKLLPRLQTCKCNIGFKKINKSVRATEKNHFVFLGMPVLAIHHILWQKAWKREMSQRGDLMYELIRESVSLFYNIRVCYSTVNSWINSRRTKHSAGSNSALQVAVMTDDIDVSLQKRFVILPKSAFHPLP